MTETLSEKRLRALWQTYDALGQQLREITGRTPLGAQPGDESPWTDLELDARTRNSLQRYQNRYVDLTVGELANLSDASLLMTKNLGRLSLRRLREAIRVHRMRTARAEHRQDEGR